MSAKDDLYDDLLASLSSNLQAAISGATFGNVPQVSVPTTVDEAIIATGTVNAHFNNYILVPLSGLPIAELLLKNGQLNEIYRGILLASLEVSPDYGDFEILEPLAGQQYTQGPNTITIQILAGTATNITCTAYSPSMIGTVIADFTEDAGTFWAPITYDEAGTWSLEFVVTFESGGVRARSASAEVST